MKGKLILNNFDGRISKIDIKPNGGDTSIIFSTKMYNENDEYIKCKLNFKEVCAINFQINYFENCVGSEASGLYEIMDISYKNNLINKIFDYRKESYLVEGDYNYNENDPNDLLNNKSNLEEFSKIIKDYHLYIQNVDAGVYIILAKDVEII